MSTTLKHRTNVSKTDSNPAGAMHTGSNPFPSDTLKKNAAKAYAAKKRGIERMPAGKSHYQRKLDAQKGFARRQSLKQAKRAAAAGLTPGGIGAASSMAPSSTEKRAVCSTPQISSFPRSSSTPASSFAPLISTTPISTPAAMSSFVSHVAPIPSSSRNTVITLTNNGNSKTHPLARTASSPVNRPITNEDIELEDKSTVATKSLAERPLPPSAAASVDLALEDDENTEDPKPPLSIQSLGSLAISTKASAAASMDVPAAPVVSKSVTQLASCSVDIGTMSRMSTVSSCTSAESSVVDSPASRAAAPPRACKQTMLSSGKWCPECAGVGLHVAALLTELAQWRSDDERRTSHSSASREPTASKSSWKRMMSQTLIGESRNSRGAQERARLQQQVDVLTATVQFLHEKLQNADAAGVDVNAALERCDIRSNH